MSVALQLVKNGKPLPAVFIDKDLHLNRLIAATIASVNLWVKIQDGSDKNPFELCVRKVMDDFGGTLFSQRPLEAVYQINYKEDTASSDLKINNFIYWNKYLQCKAFGDVYGFAQYNELQIEAVLPNKYYKFDRSVGTDGKLINPKQYNVILEPDEVDKMLSKGKEAPCDAFEPDAPPEKERSQKPEQEAEKAQ